MLQKFAMVKYGVFVAKICKHALCASTVRDIWWSPLARQLLPPWWCHIVAKFNPSYGVNFWVRCASGNVLSKERKTRLHALLNITSQS